MNRFILNFLSCSLLFVALIIPNPGFSHASSQSYSNWKHGTQGITVKFTIRLTDLNLMAEFFEGDQPFWQNRLHEHIEKNIQLDSANLSCVLDRDNSLIEIANGYFQYQNTFQCSSYSDLKITNHAFFPWDKSHMHIGRFTDRYGNIQENIFLDRNRQWLVSEVASPTLDTISITDFITQGFEHILSGWDHLAFLLALLLLCFVNNSNWKTIAILVTGFTLGHSSSLFLTMQQLLISNSALVEAYIAWSILLLVFESRFQFPESRKFLAGFLIIALGVHALVSLFFINGIFPLISILGLLLFSLCYLYLGQRLQNRQAKILLATFITTSFGFIHGLGFAGNLQTYEISQAYVLPALLGFNIGVELGQLLVIFIIFICYKTFYRFLKPEFFSALNTLLLSLLACMASFWFIERSLF